MELEFKHISGYLPHNPEFKLSRTGIFNLDSEFGTPSDAYEKMRITNIHFSDKVELEVENENGWGVGLIELEEINPILRPLSDLIKEISHNGEKIVPIVELAKLTHIKENHIYEISQSVKGTCDGVKYSFGFYNGSFWMKRLRGTKWVDNSVFSQDELFNKLNEWKFDWRYDLIKNGLAIDINTLP